MGAKRRIFIPLAITIILLIAFVAAWAGISQNDYVFKINGQKISMTEFSPYLTLQKRALEMQFGENVWEMAINEVPVIEIARDGAKQSLIDTVVKVQQAKERKLALTKEEKEENMAYVEREDVIKNLETYGITKEEFAKIREDALLIDKLAIALYKETDHSSHSHGNVDIESLENNEEPKGGVTTFDSRHILFKTTDLTAEEAENVKIKAEGVLRRILNGEDFATLAGQYSEDPGSKDNGGLYVGTERGMFVPEYENAVLSLKAGEVYPSLVKSSHGYHIIKTEGITNPDGFVSLKIANSIVDNELNEAASIWIEDLEIEGKIEVNEQRYNSAQ